MNKLTSLTGLSGVHPSLFEKALSVYPSGLIGLWPHWEAAGTTSQGWSTQSNDGTYSGGILHKQLGAVDGFHAIQYAEATTNEIGNPRAANDLGWWNLAECSRSTAEAYIGSASFLFEDTGGVDWVDLNAPATVASGGSTWTLSVIYKGANDAGWSYGHVTATIDGAATWVKARINRYDVTDQLRLLIDDSTQVSVAGQAYLLDTDEAVYVGFVNFEQKAYSTPYCDGSLGDGHSWSGTAHASTSSRTATHNDVHSAAFATDFGTGGQWAVMFVGSMHHADQWSNGVQHGFCHFGADANNYIRLSNTTTNNQVQFEYKAGGTSKTVNDTSITDTSRAVWVITVDETADEMKAYVNGSQVGSTQSTLGSWAGSLATAVIGALNTTPDNSLNGYVDLVAVWSGADAVNAVQSAITTLVP